MIKHIHVIVNPVAGQEKPILGTLNRVFHPAGVNWDVKVTKEAGDAKRYAQEAVQSGVDAVAVYGGDGTVMEVASGLIGTDVPLAIFPGGTANVMSVELGIPGDLAQASALVCGDARELRKVDMGQVNDHNFLLRVGTGFEADLVEGAPREMKDRIGNLAYVISGVQALNNSKMTRYQLILDGKEVEIEGITCMICNSGNVGQPGLTLSPDISVSDGLLDVIVIRAGDIGSILSVVASVITRNENAGPLQHWQAREITLVSEPALTVQADGEILGKTPVNIKVIPQAVHVIVPKPGAVATAAEQSPAQAANR